MASRPGAFAPEDEQAPSAEEHVVVFRLGQEYYALDIQAVQEIVRIQPTTAIPGARTQEQARANAAAADLAPLPPETMARVAEVYETHIKPLVHQRW